MKGIVAYALSRNYTDLAIEGAGAIKGKSAYEIAVMNGYSGTEKQWLIDLQGKPALINTSTETWLIYDSGQSKYIDTGISVRGIEGKSAYDIAVEGGYEGTLEQFMYELSLTGIIIINGSGGKYLNDLGKYEYITSDEVYDNIIRPGYSHENDTLQSHLDGISIALGAEKNTDYNALNNKPKINDVELLGNKTLDELNIVERKFKTGSTTEYAVLSDNNYSDNEKQKLSTIEENANNYVLPSDVVQDSDYVHTDNNFDNTLLTKLNGIEDGANKYVLPSDVVRDPNYVHTDNNYDNTAKQTVDNLINGESYSEEEQFTGKTWIDNSKIYKMTISFGNLPSSTSKISPHSIPSISKIIDYEAFTTDGDTTIFPSFFSLKLGGNIAITANKTNIEILTDSDMSSYTETYITLYYTCTDR